MNKKQSIFFGIALLHIVIATATSSASPDVVIYAFDQNPAGSDEGNEWVTFHNPSNKSEDIGDWTFESTHGTTAIDWIPEGTTLYPSAYYTCTPFYRWLDNSEEAIILRNAEGDSVRAFCIENSITSSSIIVFNAFKVLSFVNVYPLFDLIIFTLLYPILTATLKFGNRVI